MDDARSATSMVDLVERLSAEVAAGAVTREDAVQRIFEFSDGGYTRLGAEWALDHAVTFRADLVQVMAEARRGLDQVGRDIAGQEST